MLTLLLKLWFFSSFMEKFLRAAPSPHWSWNNFGMINIWKQLQKKQQQKTSKRYNVLYPPRFGPLLHYSKTISFSNCHPYVRFFYLSFSFEIVPGHHWKTRYSWSWWPERRRGRLTNSLIKTNWRNSALRIQSWLSDLRASLVNLESREIEDKLEKR